MWSEESQNLSARFGSEELEVRAQAIRDLQLGAIPLVAVLRMISHPDAEMMPRVWGMIAICHLKPSMSSEVRGALHACLRNPSATVRRVAIETLGALKDAASVPQIELLLSDDEQDRSAWFDDDVTVAQKARKVLSELQEDKTEGRAPHQK
jgi:HEAT repeat protein